MWKINDFIVCNYNFAVIMLCSCILCSLFLIYIQTNPVYAVFSFILTAIIVFALILIIGAEFFALLIIIIYTGVITVLFLFVVIMYNFRVVDLSLTKLIKNPLTYLLSYKMMWLSEICRACWASVLKQQIQMDASFFTLDVTKFIALFNDHYFLFFMCGLLIFIAMIGSIVITYPFYKHLNSQ